MRRKNRSFYILLLVERIDLLIFFHASKKWISRYSLICRENRFFDILWCVEKIDFLIFFDALKIHFFLCFNPVLGLSYLVLIFPSKSLLVSPPRLRFTVTPPSRLRATFKITPGRIIGSIVSWRYDFLDEIIKISSLRGTFLIKPWKTVKRLPGTFSFWISV